MENICKILKDHATKTINCEKLKILPSLKKKANRITNKNFAVYAEKM